MTRRNIIYTHKHGPRSNTRTLLTTRSISSASFPFPLFGLCHPFLSFPGGNAQYLLIQFTIRSARQKALQHRTFLRKRANTMRPFHSSGPQPIKLDLVPAFVYLFTLGGSAKKGSRSDLCFPYRPLMHGFAKGQEARAIARTLFFTRKYLRRHLSALADLLSSSS